MIAALAGFGCGKPMYVLEIDIENAVLSTPGGDERMRLRSDRRPALLDPPFDSKRIAGLLVHANDRSVEVAVFPSPSNLFESYFYVAYPDRDGTDTPVEITSSIYTFNGGPPQTLVLADAGSQQREAPGFVSRKFPMTLPSELAAHDVYENGDGLIGAERYRTELESERYRFRIELTVGGEPYAVDMTFRYALGTQAMGGWVGMP